LGILISGAVSPRSVFVLPAFRPADPGRRFTRDYPVIPGVVLDQATPAYIVLNLLVDLL